jgi:hypothetical protein
MTVTKVEPFFPVFTGLDGTPLENGRLYVGEPNKPTVANQIPVYWDSALTIPAAQPITTISGYPANNGVPSPFYVDRAYSLLVQDKNGQQVFSIQNASEFSVGGPVSVLAYGADPTGEQDSSPAIQQAINENNNVYIPEGIYRCDTMIEIGDFKLVELGAGATLWRLSAYTANGDPVIWMNGQYSTLKGQGQATSSIASQNRCSEGVVRVGAPNMQTFMTKDVSYNTITGFNITGPLAYGQTSNPLDIGLHFQAPEIYLVSDPTTRKVVYFNNVSNLRITDVNVGIYLHGYANGMHIDTIHGFRIGNPTLGGAMILDEGSLDNNVSSLFFHFSPDTPTVLMRQLDNRNPPNTSIPAGYQGFLHQCYMNSYRGVISEQGGGSAYSLVATDGTVTACTFETRDNVAFGNNIDAGFLERNWLFTGAAGATSSTNRFAAYASGYGVARRSMDDQNGGQLFDEYQWSIGNMVENSFYNVAEITFDNNHQSAVVEMTYAMQSGGLIAADCGGKVTYLVKKDSTGALSAEVLNANYRTGDNQVEDVAPLVPYIPSASPSGTRIYFGFRTFNNGTGGTDQDLRINARVQRSEISASVAFTPTTSTSVLSPIAPDTTADFLIADDDSRGREMTDGFFRPFLQERYHSLRNMAENTTYKAVEVTFTADQQSAVVEINFTGNSGSLVDANGGGKVIYTMVKNAAGVVSADARLSRYVPSTISPCTPQISGNTVTIPFLTYNNGTATTVQQIHCQSIVNTSSGTNQVVPTFYESLVAAASPGTPLSNTL